MEYNPGSAEVTVHVVAITAKRRDKILAFQVKRKHQFL
jgi:hypothetical protein